MKTRLFFVGVLTILIGTGLAVVAAEMVYRGGSSSGQDVPRKNVAIASFDDCISAGYPAVETYPRVCRVPGGKSFAEDASSRNLAIGSGPNGNVSIDEISVGSPQPDTLIQSPLTITGTAVGERFSNGAFLVEITDSAGRMIARGSAVAQGDWITSGRVPFSVTLPFAGPADHGAGAVILYKGNFPDRKNAFFVPIRF